MEKINNYYLSDKDFNRISGLVHEACGIKLPGSKKIMVEGRIRKRLKKLGLETFEDYCDYLFDKYKTEEELVYLIDVITTNKTDFFREPKHFEYLISDILPDIINKFYPLKRGCMQIWSAGCSTGEEPYTIAMVLNDYLAREADKLDFMILGTDIATDVLEKAHRAIYSSHIIGPIPEQMKKKYLLKSKNPNKALVRIVPELRSKVRYRRLNFIHSNYGMREKKDIVFFRNVMIYFNKETQSDILKKIISNIKPGGYLLMGHTETLYGLDIKGVKTVAPTIYKVLG